MRVEGVSRRSLAIAGGTAMVTSAVHHTYGAWSFDSHRRLHVVPVSAASAALMIVLARLRGQRSMILLIAMLLLLEVAWIGLFEGQYNHAFRLLVYEMGDPALYDGLYRRDVYEAPTDRVFELTAVIQLAPALWAAALVARASRQPRP